MKFKKTLNKIPKLVLAGFIGTDNSLYKWNSDCQSCYL